MEGDRAIESHPPDIISLGDGMFRDSISSIPSIKGIRISIKNLFLKKWNNIRTQCLLGGLISEMVQELDGQ